MYLCVIPGLFVRLCFEVSLVLGGLYAARRHPPAGVLIFAAGMFSLGGTLLFPLLECAGFGYMANSNTSNRPVDEGMMVGAWWLLSLLGPISQGVNTGLLATGVVLLARDLPERHDANTTF